MVADTTGEAVAVVVGAHQTLIWERARHALRLRSALREHCAAPWQPMLTWALHPLNPLELLAWAAPAKLTGAQISALLEGPSARHAARPRRSKDTLRAHWPSPPRSPPTPSQCRSPWLC